MTKPKIPGSDERATTGAAVPAGPPFLKTPQPDDPCEMGAEMVAGVPTVMPTRLVEADARAGWAAGRSVGLFDRGFISRGHKPQPGRACYRWDRRHNGRPR